MVTTVDELLFRTRESWHHRGPPMEVFEEAGELAKIMRKNIVADWSGDTTAKVPVRTTRDGNIGPAYQRVFANSVTHSGKQYQVPIREQWTTEQFRWLFLQTQTPESVIGNVSGRLEQMALRVQSFYKALSYVIWGDGTGRISKGDGTWLVTGNTIQLLNIATINRFEVGDVLRLVDQAAAVPASGQPTPRTGTVTVTARNETLGTLTVAEADISVAIPGAANTDYIAKDVSFPAAGDDAVEGQIDGFFRWCPITDTEANTVWANVDRSEDPARLARQGIAISDADTPWNVCIEIMRQAKRRGKPVDTIFVPEEELTAITQEMRADNVQESRAVLPFSRKALTVGMSAIEVQYVGMPPCRLMSDIYLNDINTTRENDRTYVGMQLANWALKTTRRGINWVALGTDGSQIQIPGRQVVFMSYGEYMNMFCLAPGNNIVASPRVSL